MTSKEFKDKFNYHEHEKCCANCGNGDCQIDGGVECHNPLLDTPDFANTPDFIGDSEKFPPHEKLQVGEFVHKPGCYIFTSEWAVCDNWTAKVEKKEKAEPETQSDEEEGGAK